MEQADYLNQGVVVVVVVPARCRRWIILPAEMDVGKREKGEKY
jgi:hypothetical protein